MARTCAIDFTSAATVAVVGVKDAKEEEEGGPAPPPPCENKEAAEEEMEEEEEGPEGRTTGPKSPACEGVEGEVKRGCCSSPARSSVAPVPFLFSRCPSSASSSARAARKERTRMGVRVSGV